MGLEFGGSRRETGEARQRPESREGRDLRRISPRDALLGGSVELGAGWNGDFRHIEGVENRGYGGVEARNPPRPKSSSPGPNPRNALLELSPSAAAKTSDDGRPIEPEEAAKLQQLKNVLQYGAADEQARRWFDESFSRREGALAAAERIVATGGTVAGMFTGSSFARSSEELAQLYEQRAARGNPEPTVRDFMKAQAQAI